MDEPTLATIAHPQLGTLSVMLSTYVIETDGTQRRIPYLWVGREDGEQIVSLSILLKDRRAHLSQLPNHSWVSVRPNISGIREALLATGVLRDTGIRQRHNTSVELWEYTLPPEPYHSVMG